MALLRTIASLICRHDRFVDVMQRNVMYLWSVLLIFFV